MKRIDKILNSISIVFIATLIFIILGLTCNSDDDNKTDKPIEQFYYKQNEDTTFKDLDTTTNKNYNPEYIPPKDGSSNKYWNGNKHKQLLKDRDCYFKNGLRKRKRDGTGNPNGRQLQKKYGQQRNRRGQK